MTEKEKQMYEILAKFSSLEAPVIFKGALIAKLILQENGFEGLSRVTQDMDANWEGEPPAIPELIDTVNNALGDLKDKYIAKMVRPYSENKTAGFYFYDGVGNRLFEMDINMNQVTTGFKNYLYGDSIIKGVHVDDILSDKISVLSSDKIFRRAKDVVDVYAFSRCVQVNTKSLVDSAKQKGSDFGTFHAFIHRKDELQHAYNKLKRVENKPDFSKINSQLEAFLQPFINKDPTPKVWNADLSIWRATRAGENPPTSQR